MTNVIHIMERLGADSRLNTDVVDTLIEQPLGSEHIIAAIQNADIAKLEMLLNVRNKIVCMIFPVEEPKEDPDQPDQPDQPEKQEPPEDTKTAIAV